MSGQKVWDHFLALALLEESTFFRGKARLRITRKIPVKRVSIGTWSIFCWEMGQMLERKPLFPGHNTQHQLQAGHLMWWSFWRCPKLKGYDIWENMGTKRWPMIYLCHVCIFLFWFVICGVWKREIVRCRSTTLKTSLDSGHHQLCWQAGARGETDAFPKYQVFVEISETVTRKSKEYKGHKKI